jgi:hypothetical protein
MGVCGHVKFDCPNCGGCLSIPFGSFCEYYTEENVPLDVAREIDGKWLYCDCGRSFKITKGPRPTAGIQMHLAE